MAMIECFYVVKILNLKLDTFVAQHSSIALSSVNVTIGHMEDIMKFAKNVQGIGPSKLTIGKNLVQDVNSIKLIKQC